MKQLKLIFITVLSFVFFYSCDDEADAPTEYITVPYEIVYTNSMNPTYNATIRFQYAEGKLVSLNHQEETLNLSFGVTYNGNKINEVTAIWSETGRNNLPFTYNSDGIVTQIGDMAVTYNASLNRYNFGTGTYQAELNPSDYISFSGNYQGDNFFDLNASSEGIFKNINIPKELLLVICAYLIKIECFAVFSEYQINYHTRDNAVFNYNYTVENGYVQRINAVNEFDTSDNYQLDITYLSTPLN